MKCSKFKKGCLRYRCRGKKRIITQAERRGQISGGLSAAGAALRQEPNRLVKSP